MEEFRERALEIRRIACYEYGFSPGVRHNRVCAALMLGITQSEEVILLSSNLKSFTFNELKTATQNFHPDNLVDEGRFGLVFKGWITVKNGTRMDVTIFRILDPRLQLEESSLSEARKVTSLVYQCISESKYRPSMTELLEEFESLQA
ncbi:hypothetical protein QJS10_CPA07g00237 [Acorus calamus]|uniref:Uncharacterized protein n=1 Tax=Acorus calamus TaxID=4465 RepID=A0AAV9EDY8_ACOCL|nr:hypothetical protein QJS10_CPA07g00237 [Acorus calamus]